MTLLNNTQENLSLLGELLLRAETGSGLALSFGFDDDWFFEYLPEVGNKKEYVEMFPLSALSEDIRGEFEKLACKKFNNDTGSVDKAILESKALWLSAIRMQEFKNNATKRKSFQKIRQILANWLDERISDLPDSFYEEATKLRQNLKFIQNWDKSTWLKNIEKLEKIDEETKSAYPDSIIFTAKFGNISNFTSEMKKSLVCDTSEADVLSDNELSSL